jgi:hypothetical protein
VVVSVKKDVRGSEGGGLRAGDVLILSGEEYRGLLEHKDIGVHRETLAGFKAGATQATKETIEW